jgi:SAM-dependent methyltransferase
LAIGLGALLARFPPFVRWRERLRRQGPAYQEAIRQSPLLRVCEIAFDRYQVWSWRNLPNADQQELRWRDYAPVYYSLHDHQRDDAYLRALHSLIAYHQATRVLEVGCGGLQTMQEVVAQWPGVAWQGIDITDASAARFSELHSRYPNSAFMQGSLLEHLHLIAEAELVYTYNTWMHFDADEIQVVFRALAESPRFKAALFHEPHSPTGASERIPNRLMDYHHPFKAYAAAHGMAVEVVPHKEGFATFTLTAPAK